MSRALAVLSFFHCFGTAYVVRIGEGQRQHTPTSTLPIIPAIVCGTMLNRLKRGTNTSEIVEYCIAERGDPDKCARFAKSLDAKKTDLATPKNKRACDDLFPAARRVAPFEAPESPGLPALKKSASAAGLPSLQPLASTSKPSKLPDPLISSKPPTGSRTPFVNRMRSMTSLHAPESSNPAAAAKLTNSSTGMDPSSRSGTSAKIAGSAAPGVVKARRDYAKASEVISNLTAEKSAQARLNALVNACGNDESSAPCFLQDACTLNDFNVKVGDDSASGKKKVQESLMSCRQSRGKYELMVFDRSRFEAEEVEHLIIHLVIKPELNAAKIELVATSECSKSGPELLRWIEYFTSSVLFIDKPPSLFLEDDARDKRSDLVMRYSYPLRKRVKENDQHVGPSKFDSWYEKNGFKWVGTRSMGIEKSFVYDELSKSKSGEVTTEDWVSLKAAVLGMPISVFRSALMCAACSTSSVPTELQTILNTFAMNNPSTSLFEFMVHLYQLYEETKHKDKSIVALSLRLVLTESWLALFLKNIGNKIERGKYDYCDLFGISREPQGKIDGLCDENDYASLAKERAILTQLYLLGQSFARVGEFRKDL
eukprot:TRINITY_DN20973_c0_g2_i1.p1 TRINITY_DN20973_c0_g2~~TRINITY_DN20973_c0_g2_i1.p1  ORF type:complete len:597 (+),score=48.21 TRINITY_DN20973_c0_g2_i1:43-1833(+)